MSQGRRVHAESYFWEIVRYDRSGKWFAEWTGPTADTPAWCGPPHLGIGVNSAGRAPLTVSQAVTMSVAFGAIVHHGLPGGSTFDREHRKEIGAMR